MTCPEARPSNAVDALAATSMHRRSRSFRTRHFSSVTREDGPAAKRICLGKQKYVDMPENDFVNAAVMAAVQGNFNASQAQQLAKAARRCGAEGGALAKFTSSDKRKHGILHRDVLKWLGNMGFEVEPYFISCGCQLIQQQQMKTETMVNNLHVLQLCRSMKLSVGLGT